MMDYNSLPATYATGYPDSFRRTQKSHSHRRLFSRTYKEQKKGGFSKHQSNSKSLNGTTVISSKISAVELPVYEDLRRRPSTIAPSDSISVVHKFDHEPVIDRKIAVSRWHLFENLAYKWKLLRQLQQTQFDEYEFMNEKATYDLWSKPLPEEPKWDFPVDVAELEPIPVSIDRAELPGTRFSAFDCRTNTKSRSGSLPKRNSGTAKATETPRGVNTLPKLITKCDLAMALSSVSPLTSTASKEDGDGKLLQHAGSKIPPADISRASERKQPAVDLRLDIGKEASTCKNDSTNSKLPPETCHRPEGVDLEGRKEPIPQIASTHPVRLERNSKLSTSIKKLTVSQDLNQHSTTRNVKLDIPIAGGKVSPSVEDTRSPHPTHTLLSSTDSSPVSNVASPTWSVTLKDSSNSGTPITPNTPATATSTMFGGSEDEADALEPEIRNALKDTLIPDILKKFFTMNMGQLITHMQALFQTGTSSIHTCHPGEASTDTSDGHRGDATRSSGKRDETFQKKERKRNREDDDDDEGDEEDEQCRKRVNLPKSAGSFQQQKLACHFHKSDPIKFRPSAENKRFRTCSRGYTDPKHLKEHLKRVHCPPIHCDRCSTRFKTHEEKRKHVKQTTRCEPCDDPELARAHMTDEQLNDPIFKRKPASTSTETYWYQIWEVLFGRAPRPASIYREYSELEAIFERVMDDCIPAFAREYADPTIEDRRLRRLVITIRDCIFDLLDDSSQSILQRAYAGAASQVSQLERQSDQSTFHFDQEAFTWPRPTNGIFGGQNISDAAPMLPTDMVPTSESMLNIFDTCLNDFSTDDNCTSEGFQSSTTERSGQSFSNPAQVPVVPYYSMAQHETDNFGNGIQTDNNAFLGGQDQTINPGQFFRDTETLGLRR